jgi:hypothetical protein
MALLQPKPRTSRRQQQVCTSQPGPSHPRAFMAPTLLLKGEARRSLLRHPSQASVVPMTQYLCFLPIDIHTPTPGKEIHRKQREHEVALVPLPLPSKGWAPLTVLDLSSSPVSSSDSSATGRDFWGGEKVRSQRSRRGSGRSPSRRLSSFCTVGSAEEAGLRFSLFWDLDLSLCSPKPLSPPAPRL